jgi:hypothetical protein
MANRVSNPIFIDTGNNTNALIAHGIYLSGMVIHNRSAGNVSFTVYNSDMQSVWTTAVLAAGNHHYIHSLSGRLPGLGAKRRPIAGGGVNTTVTLTVWHT